MNNDLTFFTNEPNATLLARFRKTLKDARFFENIELQLLLASNQIDMFNIYG